MVPRDGRPFPCESAPELVVVLTHKVRVNVGRRRGRFEKVLAHGCLPPAGYLCLFFNCFLKSQARNKKRK